MQPRHLKQVGRRFDFAFPAAGLDEDRVCGCLAQDGAATNRYRLLRCPRSASLANAKASYHQPPSSHRQNGPLQAKSSSDRDIGSLKKAFTTFLLWESWMRCGSELSSRPNVSPRTLQSRPVPVLSLEGFENLGFGA